MAHLENVVASIKKNIPDAEVKIEDLSGSGDHLQLNVISSLFKGLTRIQQHQMVYGALQKELADESIHALALNTSSPT